MSSSMAFCAARFTSAGAGKSGKPCDKLMALYCSASRVISRMTDSVNCSALRERRGLVAVADSGFAGFVFSAIEPAVDVRVASHDLHILARFRERNRLHKFRGFAIVLPRRP